MNAKAPKAGDRRVARTDFRLREAFVAAVREHGCPDVSIREVTRRAGVGRSTFYTHFGDLDELHGRMLRDFLGRKHANQPPFSFAGPFFEHAGKQGHAWIGPPGKAGRPAIRQRFRNAVLPLFREEIVSMRLKSPPAAIEGAAHYLAGAFTDLLFWWIDTPSGLSSAQLEALFQRLTAEALRALARP